jgi:hypothetical protein
VTGLRALIAYQMRKYADRLDRPGAPKATHVRFTFEERIGIVFRDDGRGCRLWYLGDQEYERAHTEAGPVVVANSTAWLPQRARHTERAYVTPPSSSGTITITTAAPNTPPEPFRSSPEAEHLARYCTGSDCRSPLHGPAE